MTQVEAQETIRNIVNDPSVADPIKLAIRKALIAFTPTDPTLLALQTAIKAATDPLAVKAQITQLVTLAKTPDPVPATP